MESTVTAIALVVALAVWHVRNRRHPGWRASPNGRFAVLLGYPLLVIAVYWMSTAPRIGAWEWALGNVWALAAMVSFVVGFEALDRVTSQHGERSRQLETIDMSTGSLPRQG